MRVRCDTDIGAAIRSRERIRALREGRLPTEFIINQYAYGGGSIDNGGDANFSNVVLLMRADGTDGSTTFLDHSLSTKTLTANGNAQIDTAQSQWGGSSALLDGTGDYVSAAASTDFEFGSGDLTIEFWLRLTGSDNFSIFYTEDGNTSLHFDASRWVWRANNTNVFVTTDTPALNTWYHCALVRNGATTRVYRGATMVATGTSVDCANTNSAIRIGTGYQSLNGHIDDLRITKGVARYTSAGFALPTAAFPDNIDGAHRYWRVRGFSGLSSFLEITEVQFHDRAGRIVGTLSASTAPDFGTVADLNDNDVTNTSRAYWSSATAEGSGFWIALDATNPVSVRSIRFGSNTNSGRYPLNGCEVQWSNDNSNWYSAGTTGSLTYPGNDTLSGPISF
jgi:Concanavalin A-like lectin/glucanases superfamily